MKKQAAKMLAKAQALNSPSLQQVLMNEVEKLFPGWFEAGGNLDVDGYAVTLTCAYSNQKAKTVLDSCDFWKLPANCLSCSTKNYVFSQTKIFVMPQYDDVEIKLAIQASWNLPKDDLNTLRMLGKVKLEQPYFSPPSYNEVVVCERSFK